MVKVQELWCKIKLSENVGSVVAKNVSKASRTRWLSTSHAVDGVYVDFVPIIHAINLAAEKDGFMMYLLSKMKILKSIGTICIFKAVLQELAALSGVFQRSTVNFAHILPANKDPKR